MDGDWNPGLYLGLSLRKPANAFPSVLHFSQHGTLKVMELQIPNSVSQLTLK